MIRSQRSRHVMMWAVLGPLMLALLVAALVVRRPAALAPTTHAAQGGTP